MASQQPAGANSRGCWASISESLRTVTMMAKAFCAINVAIYIAMVIYYQSFSPMQAFIHYGMYFEGFRYPKLELYRILTSAFIHGHIVHILSNGIFTLFVLAMVEKKFGSMMVIVFNVVMVFVNGAFFLFFQWIQTLINEYVYDMPLGVAVGYSGILFGFMYLAFFDKDVEITRCGLRWCTLVIKQKHLPFGFLLLGLLMPEVSFLGHFWGILGGAAIAHGGVFFLLPRTKWMTSTEKRMTFITGYESYVKVSEIECDEISKCPCGRRNAHVQFN